MKKIRPIESKAKDSDFGDFEGENGDLWDLVDFGEIHKDYVSGMRLCDGGKMMVTWGEDLKVGLWDLGRGEMVDSWGEGVGCLKGLEVWE